MSEVDPVIEEILKAFDFEKVHKAMDAMHWTWINYIDGSQSVPTIDELKWRAEDLLNDLLKKNDVSRLLPITSVSCGGFRASKEHGRLKLDFVIESWDEQYNLELPKEEPPIKYELEHSVDIEM